MALFELQVFANRAHDDAGNGRIQRFFDRPQRFGLIARFDEHYPHRIKPKRIKPMTMRLADSIEYAHR